MSDIAVGVIVSLLYLAVSATILILGSGRYSFFRTNRSWTFKLSLVVALVPISWFTMRSSLDSEIGLLAFAFLATAVANTLGEAARKWLRRPLRLRDGSLKGIALLKASEAVVVVGAILVILVIARVSLETVYLSLGKLGLGLGIGFGGFALFAALAVQQARSLRIERRTILGVLPWILLFILANAFMEELWLRALFLRPLVSLTGPIVAIVLTAAVFALLHISVSYMSKEERLRFLLILFLLGLVWGACLHFTGSIIASTLFHAGADLIVVNRLIAKLHRQKADEQAPSEEPPVNRESADM